MYNNNDDNYDNIYLYLKSYRSPGTSRHRIHLVRNRGSVPSCQGVRILQYMYCMYVIYTITTDL